jgi:hypothetical protein
MAPQIAMMAARVILPRLLLVSVDAIHLTLTQTKTGLRTATMAVPMILIRQTQASAVAV